MYCRNCGAKLPDGSVFCSACGSQTGTAQQAGTPVQPPVQPITAVPKAAKPRKPWLIALVVVLGLAAAAGVTLLCIKLFSPAPVPEGFAGIQKELMSGAEVQPGISAETPAPTAPPTETPGPTQAPTAQPTQAPTPQPTEAPVDTVQDLPFVFRETDFPAVTHASAQYTDGTGFVTALQQHRWVYKEEHVNPDAVKSGGGYADISKPADYEYDRAYDFFDDGSMDVTELNSIGGTVSGQSYNYDVISIGTTPYAMLDMEQEIIYSGEAYDAVMAFFIDTEGALVESVALMSKTQDKLVFVSTLNIYQPAKAGVLYDLYPRDPSLTQEQHEAAILAHPWSYSFSVDVTIEYSVPGWEDITPPGDALYTFNSDGTLEFVYTNPENQEIWVDDFVNYEFGDFHAYSYAEDYVDDKYSGEIDYYYYITTDGNLIESAKVYDAESGEYYSISNANVFVPYTP